MTIAEAAIALGLAPATLRLQARKGILRATKRGRDWWVEPRDVERYRVEHRRTTISAGL